MGDRQRGQREALKIAVILARALKVGEIGQPLAGVRTKASFSI